MGLSSIRVRCSENACLCLPLCMRSSACRFRSYLYCRYILCQSIDWCFTAVPYFETADEAPALPIPISTTKLSLPRRLISSTTSPTFSNSDHSLLLESPV